mmetsp:Transcript_78672/g.168603  ORF Transcript_78672/g.168603 Transcript_78672/m.168603 type:complete len:160 (-) Transcript_78672:4-483(-)
MRLHALHEADMSQFEQRPTSFFFSSVQGLMSKLPGGTGGAVGAAAGAGLGGKAMYMGLAKSCEEKGCANPQCAPCKECLNGVANKAFMASAVASGAGSMVGTHAGKAIAPPQPQGGLLDEWNTGPILASWKRLDEVGGLKLPNDVQRQAACRERQGGFL